LSFVYFQIDLLLWSSNQNRLLGETKAKIEQLLALTFENHASLDESPSSGIIEDFRSASGHAAPALKLEFCH